MDIVVKVTQLVLCLCILVFVHELGHFFFARLFKIRVDKFYLFFHPWGFKLLKAKKINGKWQTVWLSKSTPKSWDEHPETTEWGIGWLPFGGYCKIAGMIDESMDKEQLAQEPQPWEFRTRPIGQRFLVMVGGVLFNVLFAMLVYCGMLFTWGEHHIMNKDVVHGVVVGPLGDSVGIKTGDKIRFINDKEVEYFDKIAPTIVLEQAKSISVERNGELIKLPIPSSVRIKLRRSTPDDFVSPYAPIIISGFLNTSAALDAGCKEGDKIVAVNGADASYYDDFKRMINENKGNQINLSVVRRDSLLTMPITVSEEGLIGVKIETDIETTHITYGFFESIPAGIAKGYTEIGNYLKNMRLVFSSEDKAYNDVGGFIMIANVFPSLWDWHNFWNLCALISIMLAVVNILPIPVLDGGYILFLLYELITRRKPSEKFMEYALTIGFVLIIALVIFANGNDVLRLLKIK